MAARSIADLDKLHRLIQEGKGDEVRPALESLAEGQPARPLCGRIAELAWRCGRPDLGLRVLAPYVRPAPRRPRTATPEERLEYAACLSRQGGHHEALDLLKDIDEKKHPKALFYRVFPLIASWNYDATIAPLQRYVRHRSTTPYERAVGKVNLAAALIFCRELDKADVLLRELLHEASVQKLDFLLARVLELTAERFLEKGQWEEARRFLRESRDRLGDEGAVENLITAKYAAVAQARLDGGSPASRRRLEDVRALAVERAHWETVRDCDRHVAVIWEDREVFERVYFGTPYGPYRARLLAEWKPGAPPQARPLSLGDSPGGPVLDPRGLGIGVLLRRLLLGLGRDRYRPLRIGGVHEVLYPGEFFIARSSPAKVHDAIRRLRRFFVESGLPLAIGEAGGWYRLTASGPVSLVIEATGERYEAEVRRLREKFSAGEFSIAQAMAVLRKPRRTVLRVLGHLVEKNEGTRTGKGPATRYRLRAA